MPIERRVLETKDMEESKSSGLIVEEIVLGMMLSNYLEKWLEITYDASLQ